MCEFGIGEPTQIHLKKHSDGVYLRISDLELYLRKELQEISKFQSNSNLAKYLEGLVKQPNEWKKVTEVSN